MGTRSLIMVKSNGRFKVAQYCQWDGYPSGEGFKVVKFINNLDLYLDTHLFKVKVDGLSEWTEEQINALNDMIALDNTYNLALKHPELSWETGSDIFDLIYNDKVKKVRLDVGFAANSVFCEWGWCINLDTNCLDCFKGFQKKPLDSNQPFYFLQEKMAENEEYYPIKLICSIPFDDLLGFINNKDFEDYIDEILQMGENEIMDNGIPKNWE